MYPVIFALALAIGCTRPPDDAVPPPTPEPTPTSEPPFGTDDVLAFRTIAASVDDDIGSVVTVSWEQNRAAAVHLEFSFDDAVWVRSPTRELESGTHQDLLLGVPYDDEVTWRLVGDDGITTFASPDAVIATDPLPAALLAGDLVTADPAGYDAAGAPYFLIGLAEADKFADPWYSLIVDRAGRVVWALRSPAQRVALHGRVARDGRSLLLDRNSYWPLFDSGERSTIDRVLLDGSIVHTYEVPGLHHPFVDLPDGSIAWGATTGGYLNEYLKVIDDAGTVETLFDCEAWLAEIGETDAFCMSNTLTYHEPTNKFLFSQFSTDTIIQIDRSTGTAERWFGHVTGSWAFDPPESAFWWQHGGVITETGTLLTSSDLTEEGVETVVREYAIDEATQTLREIWNFGVGDGVYGRQLGEAVRLPNGNTLHNYGELALLREATPDKDVVWEIAWDSYAIGRSMPIVDLYALAPVPE